MSDVTCTVPARVIDDLEALCAEAEALEPALRSLCQRAQLAERRHDETNERGADVHPSAVALLASLGRLAAHPVAVTGSHPDEPDWGPATAAIVGVVEPPAAPVMVEDLAGRVERLEALLGGVGAFVGAMLGC